MGAMPMPKNYAYIGFNEKGAPIIEGTTMKIVELVEAHQAYGWSPEELHFQFPHIALSQIHAAFVYYWDHKRELDAAIDQRSRYAEEQRLKQGPSKLAQRFREQGLLE